MLLSYSLSILAWILAALAIDCGTVLQEDEPDPREDTAPIRGIELSGTIRVNGEPAAGLRLRVLGHELPLAESDVEGRFVLPETPRQEFVLEVFHPSSKGWSRLGREVVPAREEDRRPLDLDLRALAIPLELSWPGSETKAWGGRIEVSRVAGGRPEPACSWAITDLKGEARVAVPAPGRYRVLALRHGWYRAVHFVEVTEEPMETVRFDVQRVVPCSGKVDAPGLGDWRNVYLMPVVDDPAQAIPEANHYIWTQQDSSDFAMPNVIAGRYRARLVTNDGHWYVTKIFEVPAEGIRDLVLSFGSEE